LNEVRELQAGERVSIDDGELRRTWLWNPFGIAATEPKEDAAGAAAALRHTVRKCVHTWAANKPVLVHTLSGGLDSSIVLSCLRDAPSRPAVVCLNYFSGGRHEDERKYARLAAGRAGAKLVEQELAWERVALEDIGRVKRTARPWFFMYDLERGPIEAQVAAAHGAASIFSGAGGDSVFFQARADLAVTEYLFRHPFRARIFRVALDAARITRSSIWPLLRLAVQRRLTRRRWNPLLEAGKERTLIRPEVVAAVRGDESFLHPWMELSGAATPGVLWHVLSMSIPPAFYDSFNHTTAPERTYPLLSQPVVELCLRIPAYLNVAGGRDRSVARRAFA